MQQQEPPLPPALAPHMQEVGDPDAPALARLHAFDRSKRRKASKRAMQARAKELKAARKRAARRKIEKATRKAQRR